MKTTTSRTRALGLLTAAAMLAVLAAPRAAARAEGEIQYDGTFTLEPNGDLGSTLKFTLPMAKYQRLRDSVSNLYLMMRDLASARAGTEVVDKRSDWDDSARTLNFKMKMLGAARNLATRWEMPIPKGTNYSNYDESKRTMFFNASGNGAMGALVGSEKLVFPAAATKVEWDAGRRTVTWEMPVPKRPSAGGMLWLASGAWLVVGAVLVGVSFAKRSAPPAA